MEEGEVGGVGEPGPENAVIDQREIQRGNMKIFPTVVLHGRRQRELRDRRDLWLYHGDFDCSAHVVSSSDFGYFHNLICN